MLDKRSLGFVFFFVVCLFALFPVNLRADTCDSLVCGDANGDGAYNINDMTYITNFLYAGGPAPAPCGDIDGYDLFTIRDIVAGATMQPPVCVNQPKVISQLHSQMAFLTDYEVPANTNLVTIELRLSNTSSLNIRAFDLPLLVRVAYQTQHSFSVDLSESEWPGGGITCHLDSTAGTILLSDLDGSAPPGLYLLCKVTIRVTPAPYVRQVRFDLTELAPFMTGIFEPPNSACHYAMFLDDNLNAWKPLSGYCMCGDANNDGRFTISDAVCLICYIFSGCPPPTPICSGDASGNGVVGISDAVYIINYIYGGGPAPHCP